MKVLACVMMLVAMAASSAINIGRCVSSCRGRRNGDYQSCNGCNVYVTCSNGMTYDNMPCPAAATGTLVWDDDTKTCERTSNTCVPGSPDTEIIVGVGRTGVCMDANKCITRNGNYQSCESCNQYFACTHGRAILMECSANLVWDQTTQSCVYSSTTCNDPDVTTPQPIAVGECISECRPGIAGSYMRCETDLVTDTCGQYVSCDENGNTVVQYCAEGQQWDDKAKTCLRGSTTCVNPERTTPVAVTLGVPEAQQSCKTKCNRRDRGHFNYCGDCNKFVQCWGRRTFVQSCGTNLYWDDVVNACVRSSTTC